jgi:hypothetical protein
MIQQAPLLGFSNIETRRSLDERNLVAVAEQSTSATSGSSKAIFGISPPAALMD